MTVRWHVAASLLLALLVVVPYAQTLDDEWHFDDLGELTPGVRELSPRVPPHHYRGIVVLWTWALDFRLHGESPAGYHVTNIAIHLANVLLLYRLAWLLGAGARSRRVAAFAAAAVFAVHPLATQTVTYLTQRSTGLAALFLLLSWTSWISFRRAGRTWEYVLSLLAFAVGVHTKPVVLLVPFLVAATEWTRSGEGRRRALLLAVPFLLLAGWRTVQLAPRLEPERTAPSAPAPKPMLPRYSPAEYALTQAIVIPRYLRMMVWPAGQNLDPEVAPPDSAGDPRVIGFAALTVALGLALGRFRRSPPVVLGAVLLAGALVPTSSIVPAADLMAEHRAYVPLAGFCLALTAAFAALRDLSPRAAPAGISVLIVVLVVATARRNAVWDTELSLWTDVAAKSPGKERPHLNLGLALLRAGRPEEAEREVRRALEIRPDYAFARNNLGNLLRRRGEAGDAERQYRAAIRARPSYAEPHVNLGNLAADRGDWTTAEARYREALALRPDARDASYNLAKALESQGRIGEAIAEYEGLVGRFPDDALLLNDLGCARLVAGDAPGAERELLRAIEVEERWEVAWYNLGLAREARGDRDGAVRALERALALQPALEPARRRLDVLRAP